MVTIFKNGYDLLGANYIEVTTALERIRDGGGKDGLTKQKIEKIRELTLAGEDVSDLKKQLPSVLFHGEFTKEVTKTKSDGVTYQSKRDDSCITKHSGFLILDFDKCSIVDKKRQLMQDQYVFACWISPSGNGVKALIRCEPSIEKHYGMYTALIDRYPDLDTTSRNISRLCFESYDPDIYVNLNAYMWTNVSVVVDTQTRQDYKSQVKQRRNIRVISTAVDMVRSSYDGNKHDVLLKAATLLGGYFQSGSISPDEARAILTDEIKAKNPKNMDDALATIEAGFKYGMSKPLYESKKIEKQQQFTRRDDGQFDFIADDSEMDDYETRFLNGTLEMGLSTGYIELDKYWMIKRNTLVWYAGSDNVGKSNVAWYFAILAAMKYDWKVLIHSAENGDGQLRKKLKEFYLNKSLKTASKDELESASKFISEHFKIMTSRKLHTWEDFIIKCEIIYDEGFEYDVVIADPYNAFDIPDAMDSHRHNLKATNLIRTFKENYAAVWVVDHIGSQGTRTRDGDNNMQVPRKADVDGGQLKANKADDFIIVHRNTKNQDLDPEFAIPIYLITEMHIDKVKDTETGGGQSPKTNPFRFVLNKDKCGFNCNGRDAVREYWEAKAHAVNRKIVGDQSAIDDFLSEEKDLDAPF